MDLISKPKARRVIPNWRYYHNTLQLGELDSMAAKVAKVDFYPIDEYINDWIERKSIHRATDLISSAICNSQKENPYVMEAAKYLLDVNNRTSTDIQKKMSEYILNESGESDQRIKHLHNRALDKLVTVTDVKTRIHDLRVIAHVNPYNPIVYVDLARAYTTIGEIEKAERLIKLSLYLDPKSRFVARSSARFYIHKGDFDKAGDIIRKTGYSKYDPWLMASEISVAMMKGKRSSNIKRGEQMAFSSSYNTFSISELASTIGTIEMEDGYRKASRNLFRRSLISPNDNSLAQAGWASRVYKLALDVNEFATISNGYEEMSFRLLLDEKYKEAMDSVVEWICDMPFSEKAVIFGYDISTQFLRDYSLSSKVLEVGIKANPYNLNMINNRAYVSALANNIDEAQKEMKRLEKLCNKEDGGTLPICMTATQGLLLYRTGNINEGKTKYQQAIQMAKEFKEERLVIKAQLNMYREDILASNFSDTESINIVDKMEIPGQYSELTLLKNEILEMISKHIMS